MALLLGGFLLLALASPLDRRQRSVRANRDTGLRTRRCAADIRFKIDADSFRMFAHRAIWAGAWALPNVYPNSKFLH